MRCLINFEHLFFVRPYINKFLEAPS